ncbi:hypothetical protein ES703_66994 [subsurface metagenome]
MPGGSNASGIKIKLKGGELWHSGTSMLRLSSSSSGFGAAHGSKSVLLDALGTGTKKGSGVQNPPTPKMGTKKGKTTPVIQRQSCRIFPSFTLKKRFGHSYG